MTMTTTPAPAATRAARPLDVRAAAGRGVALAAACYVSYWLTTHGLSRVHSISPADDKLGAMWAVLATVFVYRTSYDQDVAAARTRGLATALSFVLCLVYLVLLPFHPLGLAVLIGIGALILTAAGHPDAIVLTGVTIAVVMVVAAVSPHDAWQQPLLRAADTALGIAVGLGAAVVGSWIARLIERVDPAIGRRR